MSGTAKDRPLGRELALSALFHVEAAVDVSMPDALEVFWAQAPRDEAGLAATAAPTGRGAAADVREVRDFAARLAGHWVHHAPRIDARIQAASSRWRLARMDSVDRNAMRVAICELECFPNTPLKVVISEAVRIAARFGSERSASFVNGVLATVISRPEDVQGSSVTQADLVDAPSAAREESMEGEEGAGAPERAGGQALGVDADGTNLDASATNDEEPLEKATGEA